MKKIRILIIEDNRLLRDGITTMLQKQADFHVVASFGTDSKVQKHVQSSKLHIVLLDLGLRSKKSIDVLHSFRSKYPHVKVIAMGLVPTEFEVIEYIKSGASGFLLKNATVADFLRTIRSVARGKKVLPKHFTDTLFSQIIDYAVQTKAPAALIESVQMTKRERQVINLIAKGLMNKEIAHALHLSTFTVKSHVHNILEKLTLRTRLQIAKYAFESHSYKSADFPNE